MLSICLSKNTLNKPVFLTKLLFMREELWLSIAMAVSRESKQPQFICHLSYRWLLIDWAMTEWLLRFWVSHSPTSSLFSFVVLWAVHATYTLSFVFSLILFYMAAHDLIIFEFNTFFRQMHFEFVKKYQTSCNP